MSDFPEEKHLRKIHRCSKDGVIALLDYPMEWNPSESPKTTTILDIRIEAAEPKVGIFARVNYYDREYARPGVDADGNEICRTIFPIDSDRGIKVTPRDAEGIVKDCADEIFFALLNEAAESLKSGGTLKIILPDDEELMAAFELAKNARTNPSYRNKIELIIDDKISIAGDADNTDSAEPSDNGS